jgi:hypothetical protein
MLKKKIKQINLSYVKSLNFWSEILLFVHKFGNTQLIRHYRKTEICLVFNGLPSANCRTLGKELVCRVLDPGALGKIKALSKITIYRVSTLGKEIHSVNDHFA